MPVSVCHLITDLDTGGAERSLVNLVTATDPKRFRHEVISLVEAGPMAEPLAAAGIPITSLHIRRGRPMPGDLITLVRHLRRSRPEVLQTWLYHADLLGTAASYLARPGRLFWNVRCTDITHAPAEKSIRWLVWLLARLSARPDGIVVNSHAGRRDHEALGYHPRRWIEIPNGVDLARFRLRRAERGALKERLGLGSAAPIIGMVARFHPMKDVDTFLRAAAQLARTNPAARFVLCGSGFSTDNAALMELIATASLQRRVTLLGRRGDVEDIYPALDILTLGSVYGEGFPNVLCEAMACGVPCVVTDIGDSAAIVGDTGMVIPMRDPQAMVGAWDMVIARSADELGARAHDRVAQHYSIDRMCARYAALYESAVSDGPLPA